MHSVAYACLATCTRSARRPKLDSRRSTHTMPADSPQTRRRGEASERCTAACEPCYHRVPHFVRSLPASCHSSSTLDGSDALRLLRSSSAGSQPSLTTGSDHMSVRPGSSSGPLCVDDRRTDTARPPLDMSPAIALATVGLARRRRGASGEDPALRRLVP